MDQYKTRNIKWSNKIEIQLLSAYIPMQAQILTSKPKTHMKEK